MLSKRFNQMKKKCNEIEFSKIPFEFLNFPKSENESFNSNCNNSIIDSNRILNQTDIAKPKVSIKAITKEKPGKVLYKKINCSLGKIKLSSNTLSIGAFEQDISADKDKANIEWEEASNRQLKKRIDEK